MGISAYIKQRKKYVDKQLAEGKITNVIYQLACEHRFRLSAVIVQGTCEFCKKKYYMQYPQQIYRKFCADEICLKNRTGFYHKEYTKNRIEAKCQARKQPNR